MTVSDGLHTSAVQTVTVTIPSRITVCHKGELITVSKMAAIGHIQHGDCIGTCGQSARRSMPASNVGNLISIYPNPAKGFVNISLGTNEQKISRVEILDQTGKLRAQLQVNGKNILSVTTDKLLPGIYLVRLLGESVITHKLVIE